MPTQGSSIPVLSSEKFWIDNDGRGIWFHWDGTNFFSGSTDGPWVSGNADSGDGFGATGGSGQVLPLASGMGWIRVSAMSGSTGETFEGYVPVFKTMF